MFAEVYLKHQVDINGVMSNDLSKSNMKSRNYYNKLWAALPMGNVGCWNYILTAIVIGFVMLLSSCATKTKVEYRDVNHYITNTIHDTLIDKTTDSVYVEVVTKGDTVFVTKYKEKICWRDKIVERHDTCWRDSVVTEYKEKTKEVTRIPKLYRLSLVISVLCIIFAIKKIIRWLQIH